MLIVIGITQMLIGRSLQLLVVLRLVGVVRVRLSA